MVPQVWAWGGPRKEACVSGYCPDQPQTRHHTVVGNREVAHHDRANITLGNNMWKGLREKNVWDFHRVQATDYHIDLDSASVSGRRSRGHAKQAWGNRLETNPKQMQERWSAGCFTHIISNSYVCLH